MVEEHGFMIWFTTWESPIDGGNISKVVSTIEYL